ncbi:23S rRNA (adenine(1618)-N(6))-methyltransferase RlmF [Mariniflexile sp. AS56]|uniref:23S rRNA (adenine(1618)-N(6))-methyltransferase RlmF n=1 Tax=Mariniflexile sp. AS56 TaxID=3063957 RepID=UPI0026EDFD8E|nr:23S rRNA (adenine(1618)-N(6))-methyltransferase RlmF [Mariniflexile sp. AS56]MDO7173240.1 23S rRNA (adenine(1618)-N(6))-methyltransferase RlmF [Mariniflexile sp. AS56]
MKKHLRKILTFNNQAIKNNPSFHPNNKHKSGYDVDALCEVYPYLTPFVFENNFQTKTIDFANPKAVKALNSALLVKHYNIRFWDFPEANLCPPIPGRADYIHHLSDLLKGSKITESISVLDIGTGASCIYPILGNSEYKWKFTGVDIDESSLKYAQQIITKNGLNDSISLMHQKDKALIFNDILNTTVRFSATMCNPPFYKSEEEALNATSKKLQGLNSKEAKVVRNFSGTHKELWYKGGEKAFLHNYLYESSLFKQQCFWFTTLVSKKDLVKGMQDSLKKLGAVNVKIIPMGQGNKLSRIVAWTFLTPEEQKKWIETV